MDSTSFLQKFHEDETMVLNLRGFSYDIIQKLVCGIFLTQLFYSAKNVIDTIYLTFRPVARKGYGSIAHEAKSVKSVKTFVPLHINHTPDYRVRPLYCHTSFVKCKKGSKKCQKSWSGGNGSSLHALITLLFY